MVNQCSQLINSGIISCTNIFLGVVGKIRIRFQGIIKQIENCGQIIEL